MRILELSLRVRLVDGTGGKIGQVDLGQGRIVWKRPYIFAEARVMVWSVVVGQRDVSLCVAGEGLYRVVSVDE